MRAALIVVSAVTLMAMSFAAAEVSEGPRVPREYSESRGKRKRGN